MGTAQFLVDRADSADFDYSLDFADFKSNILDLNCVCMESTCKPTVNVGIRTNLNRTMMVECRGFQV